MPYINSLGGAQTRNSDKELFFSNAGNEVTEKIMEIKSQK